MYDDTDKKRNEMGPKSGKKYQTGRGLPPIRAKQNNNKKKKQQVVHIKGMRAQMTRQANNKLCQDGGKQV